MPEELKIRAAVVTLSAGTPTPIMENKEVASFYLESTGAFAVGDETSQAGAFTSVSFDAVIKDGDSIYYDLGNTFINSSDGSPVTLVYTEIV